MNDTLVIGAGPAGLAVAAALREAGHRATILEKAAAVGSSWRRHYDRLHLHTDRGNSELPGMKWPKGTPRWPSREQVVDYLEAYVKHHELDVRFGVEVRGVSRGTDGWEVATDQRVERAKRVVIATGYPRVPVVPSWPGTFRGAIVHSSAYTNGAAYRGQRVLVVGFGNSGGEIAIDLHEHGAKPSMAVRSAVNVVPREIMGIPTLAIGIASARLPPRIADAMSAPIIRLAVGDITKLGFKKLPYGPMQQIVEHGRIPLLDIGTIGLIRQGHVALRADVQELDGDGVIFADGKREPFDAIVAATGYRPQVDAILGSVAGVLDDHGAPLTSGREAAPGLYFCGFYVAPTGMLREMAIEARRIAAHVSKTLA
jgi:indole-3-pyruvate monooxygenase